MRASSTKRVGELGETFYSGIVLLSGNLLKISRKKKKKEHHIKSESHFLKSIPTCPTIRTPRVDVDIDHPPKPGIDHHLTTALPSLRPPFLLSLAMQNHKLTYKCISFLQAKVVCFFFLYYNKYTLLVIKIFF